MLPSFGARFLPGGCGSGREYRAGPSGLAALREPGRSGNAAWRKGKPASQRSGRDVKTAPGGFCHKTGKVFLSQV